MFQKIIEYLNQVGWSYSIKEEGNTIFLSLRNNNGTYHCVIEVREETHLLGFISFLGSHCPMEKFNIILNFINAINNTILHGNFEINTLGDIKFRTAIYLDELELTRSIINGIIIRNLQYMDNANPIFSKIMFGEMKNEDALIALFPSSEDESKLLEK